MRSLSSEASNGSTTREGASTFVSTVDSLKDKASNNGTPSEFESVVKSVHGFGLHLHLLTP
ncbi:hypothetical protein [Staphylococcus pseudintermedius]|uniref:hypothetical protein n=1 Tax=Staphylococcus pseudintermedius TaxID=283734 RepID=UPI00286E9200|nr:hypothetical protein [Staphylococcus pseudintermedius]WMZ78920.1 hypothetical protein QS434_12695 [Staphylococcus pseudintermedius]